MSRSGRRPVGCTEPVYDLFITPAMDTALRELCAVTGLSRTAAVRHALGRHLVATGLLTDQDFALTPWTQKKEKH